MTRLGSRIFPLAVATAAALSACAAKDEPGIEVRVDLAEFAGQLTSLKVAIGADPDGFVGQGPTSVDNIGVTIEDIDGDGTLELVATFLSPPSPVNFRVTPGNQAMLTVSGHALAYSATALMAGADSDPSAAIALPPGGRASIALTLTGRSGGIVGPDTRTTDIQTASPDITIQTSVPPAGLSGVAVCNVDGEGGSEIVIGDPAAENLGLPVGAVHVVSGTNGFGSLIDLDNGATGTEFRFYGNTAGDRLGAAVACADLDGDGADDLIMGAPGANGGAGRVYVVFGSRGIASRQITPGSMAADRADVTWQSGSDTGFGTLLFAADLNGDGKAEILAGGAGTGKVHLLNDVTGAASAVIGVDGADHVTFSNTFATSIAAGDLVDRTPGRADVVIGNSQARMGASISKRGAVYAFSTVPIGGTTQYDLLSSDGALQPAHTIYGAADTQFGAALLVVDTTGLGQDLIVGAPGEQAGAGAFYVYKNDSEFFATTTRDYMIDATKVVTGPSANGRFGGALAGTPTGSGASASWDLVVGAPGTSRTDQRTLGGAAYLFRGGASWSFGLVEQVYGAATGDQLGATVAGGQINGDPIGDLVATAPGANGQSGVVYVRYGR